MGTGPGVADATDSRTVRAAYRRADGRLVEAELDRVSVDEVAGGQPVREFRWYRGRKHYSGWYHAATTCRLVAYESRLELARILLADFAPDVVEVAAQPFQLIGADSDRVRRHVPDLFLVHADGLVTVVDVKAPSRMRDPKVIAQFDWTRRVCSRRGWVYETWSGAEQAVVENVRFLAGYRRRETPTGSSRSAPPSTASSPTRLCPSSTPETTPSPSRPSASCEHGTTPRTR